MPSDTIELDPHVDPALLPGMIGAAHTALVVVDVQEDFVSPAGAAGRWGVDLARLEAPLGRIEMLIYAARARHMPVVFVRVVTREGTDTAAMKTLHARKGRPSQAIAICRAGTPGVGYYRVAPRAGDIEIEKTLYSAFVGTDLDSQLRARGVDTLLVTGFTTDCCVDCTVRDAFHLDYHVLVVADACDAYDDALHFGALNALSKNCALLTDAGAVKEALLF